MTNYSRRDLAITRLLLLACIILLGYRPMLAQEIPLKDFLFQVERTYQTSIIYKSELADGKVIDALYLKEYNSLTSTLDAVLPTYKLYYQKIAENTYVILPVSIPLLTPPSISVTGCITGKVTDVNNVPLIGVNVRVKGTAIGCCTDKKGQFKLNNLQEGDYELIVSYVGFVHVSKKICINEDAPNAELNVKMEHDLLNLKTVIITGVSLPLKNLDASVALTNLDKLEIEEATPRSTADILRLIPGFYVESSGGEVQNNLFSRGMPAEGSYQYVVIQEDGLPIYEGGNIDWVSADNFYRIDGSIKKIEGLRGGSAGIFASNAPGGIINMVSKTGSNKTEGSLKLQLSDYNQQRLDAEVSGQIKPAWNYYISGFYRRDDGIRPTGFKANDGGQLKANLTKHFNKGLIRFSGKYLNDKNVFYLPIPLQNTKETQEVEGVNLNYGTMTSSNLSTITFPTPKGNKSFDLTDGMHTKLGYFGTYIEIELGDGWRIINKNRFSNINKTSNAIISIFNPMYALDYAAQYLPLSVGVLPVFTYADNGEPFDILNANNNGLVVESGWWSNYNKMQNFINSLEFSKSYKNISLTGGAYFSYFSNVTERHWATTLLEVNGEQPRALNLEFKDNLGNILRQVSIDGVVDYNSFDKYENTSGDARLVATFAQVNYKISPNITIDAGFRLENLSANGIIENTKSYRPPPYITDNEDLATLLSMIYGDSTFTPYQVNKIALASSFGINYKIDNKSAVFFRFSDGYRMPDFDDWQGRQSDGGQVENIIQSEIGYKTSEEKFAMLMTGFYSQITNQLTTDASIDTNGNVLPFRTRDSRTIGIELESVISISNNIKLQLTTTAQKAIYQVSPDQELDRSFPIDGNYVKRIPRLFFIARPSYYYKKMSFFSSFFYVGARWSDELNTNILPAFASLDMGVSYHLNKFQLLVHVQNVTNSKGLTEGNPRIVGTVSQAPARMARPILGRSLVASIKYEF